MKVRKGRALTAEKRCLMRVGTMHSEQPKDGRVVAGVLSVRVRRRWRACRAEDRGTGRSQLWSEGRRCDAQGHGHANGGAATRLAVARSASEYQLVRKAGWSKVHREDESKGEQGASARHVMAAGMLAVPLTGSRELYRLTSADCTEISAVDVSPARELQSSRAVNALRLLHPPHLMAVHKSRLRCF